LKLGVAATAPFGADVLERLAHEHDVAFVVTRPDARRGRGRKLASAPAKESARRLGIDVLEPERLSADVELPDADAIVVCAYGLLIPESLLERTLWLNVHPSLLPRWRGAAPVERAIMAGDTKTGVTIHRTVKELDAGPIAAQRAFPIAADDDAGAVFTRAAEVGVELLLSVLPSPRFEEQPDDGVTYAEKIASSDRELDWNRPAEDLHNQVRALSPHIGARGVLEGRRVIVWRTRVRDGTLELLDVQPEGRRRMTYDEFLRGLR
jgi:methionyl-tRNA formyltransferase